MLGRLHQFGKTRERIPSLDIARTIHLDQNRMVTLHDEGIFVSGGGHAFSLTLALQYCDFKPEFLAALNKIAWIRLLLNKQITLRRPRLRVPLQAAVLPNGIQNLRAFRLHNRTAAANPDFATPERPVPQQAVSRRRQRP